MRQLTPLDAQFLNAESGTTVAHVGSMFTLFFHPDPVTSYTVAAKSDAAPRRRSP